jgi:hypothetical protein
MTEELRKEQKGFKIWMNPGEPGGVIRYLGEFYPPAGQVQRRMDQAYQDKLDGKISEEFWARKASEWQSEEQRILSSIQSLRAARPERLLDASRILELANKAYFLYVKQPPAEKAKLLKMVLSNCAIDAASIYPAYRKPFDLIFQRAKRRMARLEGFEPPTLSSGG